MTVIPGTNPGFVSTCILLFVVACDAWNGWEWGFRAAQHLSFFLWVREMCAYVDAVADFGGLAHPPLLKDATKQTNSISDWIKLFYYVVFFLGMQLERH